VFQCFLIHRYNRFQSCRMNFLCFEFDYRFDRSYRSIMTEFYDRGDVVFLEFNGVFGCYLYYKYMFTILDKHHLC